MRLRTERFPAPASLSVTVDDGRRWVPLAQACARTGQDPHDVFGAAADDLVGILGGGERVRERIAALCRQVEGEEFAGGVAVLPFRPRSLRCFSQWRQHWEQAARGLALRYHPYRAAAGPVIRGYERLTGRTFPPLRPGREFVEHPVYYTGNHLTVLPSGTTVPWPAYSHDLDHELEFGMVLGQPVLDADPATALAAIGGFVVFNDISARDTQWGEHRDGLFGPVVKTKNFASAMGLEVVTPDEVLPHLDALTGTVSVNGEVWSTPSTAGMQHPVADLVAWASRGEPLLPGELLTSGTLPGGSGLEIGRRLRPGDRVELRLERIGSVLNPIGTPGS